MFLFQLQVYDYGLDVFNIQLQAHTQWSAVFLVFILML